MPANLTIFAASYLVFIEALCAAVALFVYLRNDSRVQLLEWGTAAVVILFVSAVLAKIGGFVYNDPRPFTQDHVKPLISHARDNGFPSDHALLAAALVAIVLLVNVRPAIGLSVLAILVDWARVGAGIHHVADVVGSTLMVVVALGCALWLRPFIIKMILDFFPSLSESEPREAGTTATP